MAKVAPPQEQTHEEKIAAIDAALEAEAQKRRTALVAQVEEQNRPRRLAEEKALLQRELREKALSQRLAPLLAAQQQLISELLGRGKAWNEEFIKLVTMIEADLSKRTVAQSIGLQVASLLTDEDQEFRRQVMSQLATLPSGYMEQIGTWQDSSNYLTMMQLDVIRAAKRSPELAAEQAKLNAFKAKVVG